MHRRVALIAVVAALIAGVGWLSVGHDGSSSVSTPRTPTAQTSAAGSFAERISASAVLMPARRTRWTQLPCRIHPEEMQKVVAYMRANGTAAGLCKLYGSPS